MEEEFVYQTIEEYNQDLISYFIAINENFYQTIRDPSMIVIKNKLLNSVIRQENILKHKRILPQQQENRINPILNATSNKIQNRKKYQLKPKEKRKTNGINLLPFFDMDSESRPKKRVLNQKFHKIGKQDNLAPDDKDNNIIIPNSPRDNQNDVYYKDYQNTFNFQNYPILSLNGGESFTAYDFYNEIIKENETSSACHENDIKNIEKYLEENNFRPKPLGYIIDPEKDPFDMDKFRISMLTFSLFPTLDPNSFLTNRYYLILISIITSISNDYSEYINNVKSVNSNFIFAYIRNLEDGNCQFSSALLYLYLIDPYILINMLLNAFDETCEILNKFKEYQLNQKKNSTNTRIYTKYSTTIDDTINFGAFT